VETKRKRGRPPQGKIIRHYSVDKIIADFLDSLPDGERSRFVNVLLRQGIEEERLSGKFYTYLLLRPNGSVFYVGKGQGVRINHHEIEARKGVQSHKCNVIRQVWAEGEEIIKQKVGFFDGEEEAYALEMLLIKFFGRENLTNETNGGEGTSRLEGASLTNMHLDEEDRRIIAFLKGRYGLESDASVMRMALRKVAREEGYVSDQASQHRQDKPTR
jgi:hypothetical protein